MTEEEEGPLPPYILEAARSGRSKCKVCSRKIDLGAVRLGVLVDGRYGPGYMWHHVNCAAKRMLDRVEEAYQLEAWEAGKEPLDPDELPSLEKLRGVAEKAAAEREKRERERKTIPYAEIAPSNRSKCKQSGESIPLGAVRIVLGMEAHFGSQTRTSAYAVLPQHVQAALDEPEMGTERDGLAEALRENSDIDAEALEQALVEADLV